MTDQKCLRWERSASALTHFPDPLLPFFFVQCFLQILLLLAPDLWLKLTVYHAWHSLFLSKLDSYFASPSHSSGGLFSLLMKKSPTALTFLETAFLVQQGLPQRASFEPCQSFKNYCKVVFQDREIPAQQRVFSQGKIYDIVATQFKECSFNHSRIFQIAMQLPWMSFLDLLCFSEAVTKGNLSCILPICEKHC